MRRASSRIPQCRPSFFWLVAASTATALGLALGLLGITFWGPAAGSGGVSVLQLHGYTSPTALAVVSFAQWEPAVLASQRTKSLHARGFSSHTCIAVERACVVRNVCTADGQLFRYFIPTTADLANTTIFGSLVIPPELATSGRRALKKLIQFEANRAPPPLLHEADWVGGVTALVTSAVPSNAGHVVGDDMWPVFNALLAFGLLGGDEEWTGTNALTIGEMSLSQLTSLQMRVFQQWRALSPNNVLLVKRALAAATSRGRQLCFREIVTGLDAYGYSNRDSASNGKGYMWLLFRQITLERWGVSTTSGWWDRHTSRRPRILFVEKGNKRHVLNHWEAIGWIQRAHPEADVQLVVWDRLSMDAQIRTAAFADIMIGVPGTSIFNAYLMPPGACLITLCQVIAGASNCGNEKVALWDHFAHLRQRTYTEWENGDLIFHPEILSTMHEAQRAAVLAGNLEGSGDPAKYWMYWGSTDVVVRKDRLLPLVNQCIQESF